MKFSAYISSMYGWLTVTLVALVLVASAYMGQVPVGLVVSVITATAVDLGVKYFALGKKQLELPHSAIITGLIVGSILPFGAQPLAAFLGAALAIASKYALRLRGVQLFNPSAFGLLVALAAFGLTDQWWANTHYSIAGLGVVLTPLLVFANYKADRLRASLAFLVVSALLYYAGGLFAVQQLTAANALNFLFYLPYFMAFVLISDPRTTPARHGQQAAFGVVMAFLAFALLSYGTAYALLLAVLIGNAGFAAYNMSLAKSLGRNASIALVAAAVVALAALYFASPLAAHLMARGPSVPPGLLGNGSLNQAVADLNALRGG